LCTQRDKEIDTIFGNFVCKTLTGTVSQLQENHPISLQSFLMPENSTFPARDLNLADLRVSDQFFNSIPIGYRLFPVEPGLQMYPVS
jgi:hypothetical protein